MATEEKPASDEKGVPATKAPLKDILFRRTLLMVWAGVLLACLLLYGMGPVTRPIAVLVFVVFAGIFGFILLLAVWAGHRDIVRMKPPKEEGKP